MLWYNRREAMKQQSLDRVRFVFLVGWAVLVSIITTGYLGDQGWTHLYSIPLVQKWHHPELYPHDPFVETAYSYASAYWYLVAWLTSYLDISVVLTALFLITRVLLVIAAFWLARVLFPNTTGAVVAALVAIAMVPNPIVGHGAPIKPFAEHTTLAISWTLLSLVAFIERRWLLSFLFLGIGISNNLLYALFGASYLLAAALLVPEYRQSWCQWLRAAPVALLAGLPGILLVYEAAGKGVGDPLSVWKTAEIAFTGHFFLQTGPLANHAVVLALMGISVWCAAVCPNLSAPFRRTMMIWTLVAFFWYVLAWLTPSLFQSLTLLRLHLIRGHDLWIIAATIFLAGAAAHWMEIANPRLAIAAGLPALIGAVFWHMLVPRGIRRLVLLVGIVLIIGLWVWGTNRGFLSFIDRLNKRFDRRFIYGGLIILATVAALTQYALQRGYLPLRPHVDNTAVLRIAEWAKRGTPLDTVFLIPLDDIKHSDLNNKVSFNNDVIEEWRHFRHLSQRSVFVGRAEGMAWPYAAWYAAEWLSRIRALGFFEVAGLNESKYQIGQWVLSNAKATEIFTKIYLQLDDKQVLRLKQQYRIDYWIAPRSTPSRFPTVYEHGYWKVLRLPQREESEAFSSSHL